MCLWCIHSVMMWCLWCLHWCNDLYYVSFCLLHIFFKCIDGESGFVSKFHEIITSIHGLLKCLHHISDIDCATHGAYGSCTIMWCCCWVNMVLRYWCLICDVWIFFLFTFLLLLVTIGVTMLFFFSFCIVFTLFTWCIWIGLVSCCAYVCVWTVTSVGYVIFS